MEFFWPYRVYVPLTSMDHQTPRSPLVLLLSRSNSLLVFSDRKNISSFTKERKGQIARKFGKKLERNFVRNNDRNRNSVLPSGNADYTRLWLRVHGYVFIQIRRHLVASSCLAHMTTISFWENKPAVENASRSVNFRKRSRISPCGWLNREVLKTTVQ